MTTAYLLEPDGTVIGLLGDAFEELKVHRRWQDVDTFELKVNARRRYADEVAAGRVVHLASGDHVHLIEQVATTYEGGRETKVASGRSLEGMALVERLAIPPPGLSHDAVSAVPAETAIKHYVDEHAGAGSAAARQLPGLVMAPDLGRGMVLSAQARWQPILNVLHEIGLVAAMGWEVRYDPVAREYVFDVIPGVDRSATVLFDVDFNTLSGWEELVSLLDSKSMAAVAGQGEGVDREVVIRHAGGVEATGFNRREAFIDARDVEPGLTAILEQRGDAFLASASGERRFKGTLYQFGSFRYGEDFDLGDVVTVRDARRAIQLPVRLVGVQETWARASVVPTLEAELDRPWPTLRERVSGSSGARTGSVQDTPITLPPDAHAASHAPLGSDPVANLLGAGVAFPAQPAWGTVRPFLRTDRGIEYRYDGTRWLSTELYSFPIPLAAAFLPISATTPALLRAPWPAAGIYGTWLEDVVTSFFVAGGTALSASHKWVGTLVDGGSGTLIATVNIDAGALSTWRNIVTAVNGTIGSASFETDMTWTKTGTPGNLYVVVALHYRLVG